MKRHMDHDAGGKPVRILRARYFVWVIVPIALITGYAAFGLPHVIWSYEFHAPRSVGYGDFDARTYTRCSYLGPYGLFTEHPIDGTCGWVRFRKKGAGQ